MLVRSSSHLTEELWCVMAVPLFFITSAIPPGGRSALDVPGRRPDVGKEQLKGRVVNSDAEGEVLCRSLV